MTRTRRCPPPARLHACLDGVLSLRAHAVLDEHLRDCGECRDALRMLRRVERFVAGLQEPGVGGEEVAGLVEKALRGPSLRSPGPQEPPPPRGAAGPAGTARAPVWRIPMLRAASVIPLLALLVILRALPDPGAAPVAAARPDATQSLQADLRRLDPDLSAPASSLCRELIADPAWGREGRPKRRTLARAVRRLLRDGGKMADRLRAARVAAGLGLGSLRPPLEALLVQEDLERRALRHGCMTLAAFGGRESARALLRVAARRSLAPRFLASALVRTRYGAVAPRVWRLLRQAGVSLEDAYLALGRVPGREAARLLARDFLAGERAPILGRLIAEREAALAILRRELPRRELETRIRILGLLGRAGDCKAVPLLARGLRSQESFFSAAWALEGVAQAGFSDALFALARCLPPEESPGAWPRSARQEVLDRVFRSLPRSMGALLLAERSRLARASERRRFLLAAALCGRDAVVPALVQALAIPNERRGAMVGLAIVRHRPAARAVVRYALSRNRGTRRCALVTLACLGGRTAATALRGALCRTLDRHTVVKALCDRDDVSLRGVLLEGLRYRDSHDACSRALRRLAGGAGPPRNDHRSWEEWLGSLTVPR